MRKRREEKSRAEKRREDLKIIKMRIKMRMREKTMIMNKYEETGESKI